MMHPKRFEGESLSPKVESGESGTRGNANAPVKDPHETRATGALNSMVNMGDE